MSQRKEWSVWCATVLLALGAHGQQVPAKAGPFPQEVARVFTQAEGLPSNDATKVRITPDGVHVETSAGSSVLKGDAWQAAENQPDELDAPLPKDAEVKEFAIGKGTELAIATNAGLFVGEAGGETASPEPLEVKDGLGRSWATEDVRGVAFDSKGQLWFATLAGVGCRTSEGWKFYEGKDGLPYNDFTCAEAGPNGEVWFGTKMGAVRFDENGWHYRQGRRWLPNDDVRDIAVDAEGNAWFATAGGVGVIERRMMTLAEKAAFYEEEMELIKRTPYGYVSEVSLARPGDKREIIYTDSDNDGLWTAMYGAGECFAYVATKDQKAKERAKQAFKALQFLQQAPAGSEHAPPKGYVARTILPTDGPDPNEGRIERDRREREEGDSLWKVYEPRWPKSADGKWYWKSDTSSDELDGHYFFYPAYYDLAAETEEEKEEVRQVVRDLTDHLMEHGFNLVDHDGEITRWGYYGPEHLNHSKWWWIERGLKSLSILSYLTVAEHITGDAKYGEAAQMLRDEHAYDTNAMVTKVHIGLGSSNQSDDEMAVMCYYNLVKYTKDPKLREEMLYSFYYRYALEEPEMNPFFNFAYAAVAPKGTTYTSPFGTNSIEPWQDWLSDSMTTLKGFPLDRVDWAHKNSHRLDIVLLQRQVAFDPINANNNRPIRRGHRVNGKVLPVENRHFNHWNTDPWQLDYGGEGRGLASGTVFLLPYYMGLYHGFIEQEAAVKSARN